MILGFYHALGGSRLAMVARGYVMRRLNANAFTGMPDLGKEEYCWIMSLT